MEHLSLLCQEKGRHHLLYHRPLPHHRHRRPEEEEGDQLRSERELK